MSTGIRTIRQGELKLLGSVTARGWYGCLITFALLRFLGSTLFMPSVKFLDYFALESTVLRSVFTTHRVMMPWPKKEN